MPVVDPTNGATFKLSRANRGPWDSWPAMVRALDGSVGFDSTASFTFDPNNRAVAGKVDFIGLAEHEISEVMGPFRSRTKWRTVGKIFANRFFRYSSPDALDLVPENGAYFSINGGTTIINTFNGTGGGDLSDWAGRLYDSYNAFLTSGVELPVSAGDITVLDVIGYDLLLPGDFNQDGHVNAADIQAMMQALADTSSFKANNDLTDPAFTKMADNQRRRSRQ